MERKENLKENKGVSVANSQLNQQPSKITGILTSRIEVKPSSDIPAYGFFKIDNQETEIPVIFRIKAKPSCQYCDKVEEIQSKCGRSDCGYYPRNWKETWIKPQIKKGSLVELTGNFIGTVYTKNSARPSFTCSAYQLLSEPQPLNTADLITLTSGLLTTTLEKYKEWTNRKDFLFKKLDELKEIATLAKLGEGFLRAYLLLKSASYANYQTKLLNSNFDLTHYLETISTEIQLVRSHIEAYQSKQINHGK